MYFILTTVQYSKIDIVFLRAREKRRTWADAENKLRPISHLHMPIGRTRDRNWADVGGRGRTFAIDLHLATRP